MYEVVGSLGIGDVRRVVSLKNGQTECNGGDQSGRSGVLERAGIVDHVADGASRSLEVSLSERKSKRGD